MARRPSQNPFGQGDPSVDGILGGAFNTVKYVALNLPVIKQVADWIMNGGTLPDIPGGGGGGTADYPSFVGAKGKALKVNDAEDGVYWAVDETGGSGNADYPPLGGNAGKALVVNSSETGVQWAPGAVSFPEAPLNGKIYGRKDAAWAEIVLNAGGRGITSTQVRDNDGHLLVTYSDGEVFDAGSVRGKDGEDGDPGFGSIVNFTDYKAQPAGGAGVYMIIPVAQGAPGVTLTQSASVTLPKDTPNAGAGLWIESKVEGYKITLGLSNAPEPQPGAGEGDVDLSGSGTIYGSTNSIFSLGIFLGNTSSDLYVQLPSTLVIKIKRESAKGDPVGSSWRMGGAGAPYVPVGDAVTSAMVINKSGSGFDFRNGNVVINEGSYLFTNALGLEFTSTSDETVTQTPKRIRLGWKGVIPTDTLHATLIEMQHYGVGQLGLQPHYQDNQIAMIIGRNGSGEAVFSDSNTLRKQGTNQLLEAEFNDVPGGEGGYVTFFVDGVQVGQPKFTTYKPRVTPFMTLECNASVGNAANSINNLEVESIFLSYDKPGIAVAYEDVQSGEINLNDLQSLVADASTLSGASGPHVLTYYANKGGENEQRFDLSIMVGEMQLPAGRAYKAVLQDWSSGAGVNHPNELVMTRIASQNCRFEDGALYGSQPSWMEVLPKGPVPNINGINYYCEGVRIGNYVEFQFIYDWDTTTMPANPFGDPSGKDSYMIPHKWLIYDSQGTLLGRIEQPNGEPLNNPSRPPCWEGTFDGRGVAVMTKGNEWYAHGTVRASHIWRSHDPVAYDQQFIWDHIPVYDARVPFACSTGYSVNGGDARCFSEGQINGFANYRAMPWEKMTTEELNAMAAAVTYPWKSLYTSTAVEPNAILALKYHPFNSHGRSPITAPGGVRDDRQIMPDMIAQYCRDVTSKHPMHGRSLQEITLSYLTGYASDPIHVVEKGSAKPLYKGNPRRSITMRNHYYGPGQGATPDAQAYYVQGGRPYEWMSGSNPLRVKVPYAGKDPKKPLFGTHMIDSPHAHQFPHWGSMLFQTPVFAMMGHKFSDQTRLYNNVILNRSVIGIADRDAAWSYMHAVMMWKTASSNSSRLYSRAEVLDWVVFDFESFYDLYYASNPGFLNPPDNIWTNGSFDLEKAMFASSARFGIVMAEDDVYTHDFMVGYWLSALHAGHRMGFNDALRAASPKAKAVVDWLCMCHKKRIIDKVNNGMLINALQGFEYLTPLWSRAQIDAAKGDVSKLPKNYAEVYAAQATKAPTYYQFIGSDGEVGSRDGQSFDQLLAGPGLIKDMGFEGAELDAAYAKAEQCFQERYAAEAAKGAGQAGQTFFKFHQVTNNRPWHPPTS